MIKKIVLWSHPRSRSTAVERSFIEREDFHVVHEPLSMSKYKGANEGAVIDAILALPASAESAALKSITYVGKNAEHVFIKDFPYHCPDAVEITLRHGFVQTFLVREPYETILSWQNVNPGFQEFELGYHELLQAIREVKKTRPARLFVIQSSQLAADATAVLRSYCDYLDVPFEPAMCNWSSRESISAWNVWRKYHTVVQGTRGFVPPKAPRGQLTATNKVLYGRARRVYEQILQEFE